MKNPPKIDLGEIGLKFKGRFKCVLNEGTDREVSTGWFHNLVLDSGLDRFATTSPNLFTWACVGTGTNAPANSDTTLQSYVASTSNLLFDSGTNAGPSTYVAQCQMHWTYTLGSVVGNMAEVGVGWASGGGSLWSRALILDSGGSPTTLTVTSSDQLIVYYELTCTPTLTDVTGTIAISGTNYNYTGRISNCASFGNSLFSALNGSGSAPSQLTGPNCYATQILGAITSTPAGSAAGGGTNSPASYTNGTKHRDNTISWGPLEGDSAGGVGAITINAGGIGQFQYSFAAASGGAVIPKDATKTMSLTFRVAWDRL